MTSPSRDTAISFVYIAAPMSFTSTPLVATSAVLMSVVKLFFSKLASMENILQSLVKIIIVGILLITTNVKGNRQFFPPPLPYYQNDNYFLPGFLPPFHDPSPVYYREHHPLPPISYQNLNAYPTPQLFHQNENYDPTKFTHPNVRYSMFQYKNSPVQPYNEEQKNTYETPQVTYKKPQVETPQKKPAFYATNIIIKDEAQPSFYHDDLNKNYHEDDYSDSYSDEGSAIPEPCLLSSPYRYFESKESPTKYTLCNPHFQPNFGNSIYTVKMPITLLPSRFPPRVEQLIERIQNYFSTYTEQETPKPQNETTLTTTVAPTTITQSDTHTTIMTTTDDKKKNTTSEIEELGLEELNPEPTAAATVAAMATATPGKEPVTQKTIVVKVEATEDTTENEEIVEAHIAEKSQTASKEVTEHAVSSTASGTTHQNMFTTNSEREHSTVQVQQESSSISENFSENQISNELSHFENFATKSQMKDEVQLIDVKSTTGRAEDTTTVQPTKETLLEITDKNG